MFFAILRFELQYWLKHLAFYVYAALFFLFALLTDGLDKPNSVCSMRPPWPLRYRRTIWSLAKRNWPCRLPRAVEGKQFFVAQVVERGGHCLRLLAVMLAIPGA